jgi:AraC-like DNA-binding protein
MLRAAPTVGEALQLLTDNLALHDEGANVTLSSDNGVSTFCYRLHTADNPAADQIYDLSMVMASHIMRALCGPQWAPMTVRLSRHGVNGSDCATLRRFFRSPLQFGAPYASLLFATRQLDQRIASADPLLLEHFEHEARQLRDTPGEGLQDRLRQLLPARLAHPDLNETDIARQLGLHQRTLHRRLRAEGTSFRAELRRLRYATACELLAQSEMSLTEIGAAVGYSDTSAFSRAFRGWAGMTASAWRHAHSSATKGSPDSA